jgi:hypothetical protein
MKLAVVDINGSRARAVAGGLGSLPQSLALDGTRPDLATAIRLDGRRSEAGQAAVAICRQYPHLVCEDFLASLDPTQLRRSVGGVNPERALALVVARLREPLSDCDQVWLCLPGYLSEPQAMECRQAFAKTRFSVLGTIPSAVALAMAVRGGDEDRDFVTLEADSHGLTLGRVEAGKSGLRLTDTHVARTLAVKAWSEAMLNGIAEICIRQNRRDFRDSGAAEQGIFGQLDDVTSAASRGELIEIVIRTKQWCQNLILRPDQINAMCEPLAVRASRALAEWLEEKPSPSRRIILSDETANLPGLKVAIQDEINGIEIAEISTTKAMCRLHAQATQWAGTDPGKMWNCLPPVSASAKSSNERPRSLRIRWR